MVNFFLSFDHNEKKVNEKLSYSPTASRLMTKTLTVSRSPLWALAIGCKSYFPIETLLVRSVLIRD